MSYRGRGYFDVEVIEPHVALFTCSQCGLEKPESAYVHRKDTGVRMRNCRECMRISAAKAAAKRYGHPVVVRVPSVADPTPMPVTVPDNLPAIVSELARARVEVMTLRDWYDMDLERSAMLCGVDLFVRVNASSVWVFRPDGAKVTEPIHMNVVLALAGNREGFVFY